jgi:hypothetical protein
MIMGTYRLHIQCRKCRLCVILKRLVTAQRQKLERYAIIITQYIAYIK